MLKHNPKFNVGSHVRVKRSSRLYRFVTSTIISVNNDLEIVEILSHKYNREDGEHVDYGYTVRKCDGSVFEISDNNSFTTYTQEFIGIAEEDLVSV